MSKILITGAHFTPAVAVIEELKKQKEVEILYVGRRSTREGDSSQSVESQILPRLGVKFIPIITGRIQRSFTIYTIPSLLKIPIGLLQAFCILLREKPDVVLSFGGYVAVPIVICAWALSIKIIVHEQTLVVGLANTISNFFADRIALSFEKENLRDNRVRLTGNPIRVEILNSTDKVDPKLKEFFANAKIKGKPIVLITGGNQGSHIINQTVKKIIPELIKNAFVIHQTGDSKYKDFEDLIEISKKNNLDKKYFIRKWIDSAEFGYILKNSDLVITRAGANTLLEIAYIGVPSIIIPLPYIYRDEQTKNARFYESRGLGRVLLQKDLNSNNLLNLTLEMIKDLDIFSKQAKKGKEFVIKDGAKRLALETLLLCRGKINEVG